MTRRDWWRRYRYTIGLVGLWILVPFALWQELNEGIAAAVALPTRFPLLVWAAFIAAFAIGTVIVIVREGRQLQRLRQRAPLPGDKPQ
jgi:hypothetical protein